MYYLFSQIARVFAPARPRLGHAAVPRALLESAEARAGLNPRHASELRGSALAYLRVVR
jgi:regulator of sirC expression with transglutaminase-like and TPR domain